MLSVAPAPLSDNWPLLPKGRSVTSNTLLPTDPAARSAIEIPMLKGCQDASSNDERFSERSNGSVTEVAAKGVASHHSAPMSLGLEDKDNRLPEKGAKGDWVDELS